MQPIRFALSPDEFAADILRSARPDNLGDICCVTESRHMDSHANCLSLSRTGLASRS